MSVRAAASWAALLTVAMLTVLPCGARALQFSEGNGVELLDAAGNPETRAGAHPDRLVQRIGLVTGEGAEDPKELVIELPPGLSGSADAVPACSREAFGELLALENPPCTEEQRIGTFYPKDTTESFAIYNLEPAPNELAVFAGWRIFLPFKFFASLQPDHPGLLLRLADIPQKLFEGGTLELWGVPADHQEGTSVPRRPLLTTPTECAASPPAVKVSVDSWQHPDQWTTQVLSTGHPLGGCDSLPFSPGADFALADQRADAPSGAKLTVTVPQQEDPDGRESSMVRGLSIAMPNGLTVSPGGTAGLTACGDEQFGLGRSGDPECPPSSEVGSVRVQPAGGAKALVGSVYLGEEHPGDRFRLFVAAAGPGAELKFAGSLHVDAATGGVSIDLDGLPPWAFASLSLEFKGGPRSLLATPLECGPATTRAAFTPYSGGPAANWKGTVEIGSADGGPCLPAPFAPAFEGGSTDPDAGQPTAFTTTIRRADGEKLPAAMTITLPAGVGAAVGRVARCSPVAADCPAGSRIGDAVAELGPGLHPARIDGRIYLTGPYRGAPFGVAIVFDPELGPYSLGPLVVRGALDLDTRSGRVRVRMQSLPTVFEGVPVRFQTIGFDLDRPGFIFNPTSCSPSAVSAVLRSEDGSTSTASSGFKLRRCLDLAFEPRLALSLGTPSQLHRGGHPSLLMSMRMRARSANLKTVEVRLPAALRLDAGGVAALCSHRRAVEGRCPHSAQVGTASIRTPLLKKRMNGSLYVVQPRGSGEPEVWADVAGQGLELSLRAELSVHDGRVTASFRGLPDFPLRALVLRLTSGGLLRLAGSPCGDLRVPAVLGAQNGIRREIVARAESSSGCGRDG